MRAEQQMGPSPPPRPRELSKATFKNQNGQTAKKFSWTHFAFHNNGVDVYTAIYADRKIPVSPWEDTAPAARKRDVTQPHDRECPKCSGQKRKHAKWCAKNTDANVSKPETALPPPSIETAPGGTDQRCKTAGALESPNQSRSEAAQALLLLMPN